MEKIFKHPVYVMHYEFTRNALFLSKSPSTIAKTDLYYIMVNLIWSQSWFLPLVVNCFYSGDEVVVAWSH